MSKSNTTICAANKCYSSIVTHPSKSFFGFPSDLALCKTWLENCGRTDLKCHRVSKGSYWRLCEDHFEDKWFTDGTKKVLKRKLNPVPTIFVNNIDSLISLEMESESIDGIDDAEILVRSELGTETENETILGFDSHCELNNQENSELNSLDSCEVNNSDSCELNNRDSCELNNSDSSELNNRDSCEPNNSDSCELNNRDSICRFCMNDVPFFYIDIFAETDDARDTKKIIETILSSKVSACDGLPHKVCQQCIFDLKSCWNLIKQFRNADQYLRSIAKNSSTIKKENVTEMNINCEKLDDGTIDEDFDRPLQQTAVVWQLDTNFQILEQSYGSVDELNIGTSLKANKANCCTLEHYNLTPKEKYERHMELSRIRYCRWKANLSEEKKEARKKDRERAARVRAEKKSIGDKTPHEQQKMRKYIQEKKLVLRRKKLCQSQHHCLQQTPTRKSDCCALVLNNLTPKEKYERHKELARIRRHRWAAKLSEEKKEAKRKKDRERAARLRAEKKSMGDMTLHEQQKMRKYSANTSKQQTPTRVSHTYIEWGRTNLE